MYALLICIYIKTKSLNSYWEPELLTKKLLPENSWLAQAAKVFIQLKKKQHANFALNIFFFLQLIPNEVTTAELNLHIDLAGFLRPDAFPDANLPKD